MISRASKSSRVPGGRQHFARQTAARAAAAVRSANHCQQRKQLSGSPIGQEAAVVDRPLTDCSPLDRRLHPVTGRASSSIADALRCIDGPLASVHDIGLGDLPYSGATAALTDVWRALRASMRHVLEETSLADVATGALPEHVAKLADDYRGQEKQRGHRTIG